MSYKALYRIYRPKDFTEVAGQTHITTTLKNALVNDKVAHAYLFSGPRGTGKTSIAKILAKAVNCIKAPAENPCNECDHCLGIQNGTISDIIEIDAASNNGVDEIREIRDKVKYLPGYVKYKVYIIDEVHMLSTGAFNALLKTLEEPPAHVIFILCTTEPQKIPLTIHSRCQRFDFKAITTHDIIGKLNEIIEEEKISIDDFAIKHIALHAEGGLRDAISLLDQAHAYSPEHITEEDVNQISGAVSSGMLLELAEALIQGNSANSIEILNELVTEGKEVNRICQNLIEFFRDILMVKNLNKLDENNLLINNERFIQLSKMVSNRKTFYILDVLNRVFNEIKWSNSAKIYLELSFIRITDAETGSESKLVSAVDMLEKRIDDLEHIKDNIRNNEITNNEKIINQQPLKNNPEEDELDLLEDIEIDAVTMPEEDDATEIINEVEAIEEKLCSDIDNTYSIAYVESVLNNGNRDDKNDLINDWDKLRRSATNDEEKHFAQILEAGQLVASSVTDIIITFPSASICNKLMTPNNKTIVKAILKQHFNRDMDYIALPDDVFTDIANEFAELWKQGKRNIKLSKIQCEGLVDVSSDMEDNEHKVEPKIVSDAKDLFGDIVNVKE